MWLGTTPLEREVVVNEQESLADIARRTLGDPKGASELKALNGLTSDAVPAGTRLKLPPVEERKKAESSLQLARNAVAQADRKAERREEALAKLQEAEAQFQAADYVSAGKTADSAWALLAPGSAQPSVFQVSVTPEGDTTVTVKAGPPVRVRAEDKTRAVNQGETVHVEKGRPVPAPEALLAPPQPRTPSEGVRLKFAPVRGKLGPVKLTWSAVSGAKGYEVEVQPAEGELLRQTLTATQWELPPLPAGRYRWRVKAVGDRQKSNASPDRLFELIEDRVTLKVGEPTWK
jgi:LysM repeat protein